MMDVKKALERQESKVGWNARIVLTALTACGLIFGPWVMFFHGRWFQSALIIIFVALVAFWFIKKSATEPAPFGFGLVEFNGAPGVIGNVTMRVGFGAKVYLTFATIVVAWWLVAGLGALVNFIQTLAVPPPAYAPPVTYDESATSLLTVFVGSVAFFLCIWLATLVVNDILRRRLAKQNELLRAEKATAVATEEDSRRQLERKVERARSLVNQAVGMLMADKRHGDKAIGDARQKLEEALLLLDGHPTANR